MRTGLRHGQWRSALPVGTFTTRLRGKFRLHRQETNAGEGLPTIEVGDSAFAVQRVVQTGVDFSVIRDLNTVAETFYADFFVWFKYYGDDDAADVIYTNISDPQTLTIDEVRSTEVDGMKYKVFRVTGTFTSPLNFHSFPFDAQDLLVHFQNRTLPSSELVYAIDSDFAQIPISERLSVGGNATESISQISNWHVDNLQAFAGSVGTSSNLGDPEVKSASQGIEFAQVGRQHRHQPQCRSVPAQEPAAAHTAPGNHLYLALLLARPNDRARFVWHYRACSPVRFS